MVELKLLAHLLTSAKRLKVTDWSIVLAKEYFDHGLKKVCRLKTSLRQCSFVTYIAIYPPVDFDLLVPDPKSLSTSQYLRDAKPTNCGLTNLSVHSSEIKGLCSTKYSSETLQNLLYIIH